MASGGNRVAGWSASVFKVHASVEDAKVPVFFRFVNLNPVLLNIHEQVCGTCPDLAKCTWVKACLNGRVTLFPLSGFVWFVASVH